MADAIGTLAASAFSRFLRRYSTTSANGCGPWSDIGSGSMVDNSAADEMARCDVEIADITASLLNGHSDINGHLLGIFDWEIERRLIEKEHVL